MAHDVFLSYCREDVSTMQQLEKALREAGFTIWTDRGIAPGSPSWKTEIEKAIREARCIVVLFSPEAADSRWVRAELDYADAQRKPIYPLLVRGDTSNAVPFGFTTYQWIDVRKSSQWVAGLLQLTAALRGTPPALPTTDVPIRPTRIRGLLPLAAALLIAVLIGGVLLINNLSQTAAPSTATVEANVAQVPPTALPTMPPFAVPSGFKKIEGEKTLVAVPTNWTTDFDPDVLLDTFMGMVEGSQDAAEMVQTMMQNLDIFAVDMLRFQGFVVTIEDTGIPLSYALLETRTKGMFEQTGLDGTFTSKGLVEMPAGTMLVAETSDGNIFTLSYNLIRGTDVYNVTFSSRAVDTELVQSIADRIVQTFRVKE
jgi:hypothetical protein